MRENETIPLSAVVVRRGSGRRPCSASAPNDANVDVGRWHRRRGAAAAGGGVLFEVLQAAGGAVLAVLQAAIGAAGVRTVDSVHQVLCLPAGGGSSTSGAVTIGSDGHCTLYNT